MSKKEKHILVIRLSALGDVAMTIPVILTLLKQYPELKVSVLTKPFFAKLFKDIPQVNTITANVENEHDGLSGLSQLSRELKKYNFSGVADLHNVLRTKILKFFLFFQDLKIKSINKGRKDKKALTRTKNKVFKRLKTTAERYADVFSSLGYFVNLREPVFLKRNDLEIKISDELQFHEAKKRIGIAPFAAHDGKVYPTDLMQECIKQLAEDKNLHIYLFGAEGQEMSRLHNWAHPYSNVYCIAGKYDFEVELDLISNLDLMLSMDSGNGHLAAMYGVKVITIWGQTHPHSGFAPFLQTQEEQIIPDRSIFPLLPTSVYGNKKIEGYSKVMRSIKPERIVETVNRYLN
jgi:ADP-heptose:LPS heptosyltransferase